ncbi:hypothetical protein BDR26DRAFT_1009159 [Obelidium mucronatum]|nr:hypothetical protein BDR26DRAFT_1009159 [Obelidium mucronatum]
MKVFDRARNGLHDAKTQVIIVAIVCFLCPGMFNALNSIQGESNEVERIKSLQTAVLYLAFSVFSLLAGGLNNLVGPRALLVFAGSTYSLFVASKFAIHLQDMADKAQSANITGVKNTSNTNTIGVTGGLAYGAGALLGMGAACLWAAQGAIVMTYPTDNQRGTYFAYFWIIFNMGAVICSVIAFGQSVQDTDSVSTMTYVTFIALPALGSLLALFVATPNSVIREDKSKVKQNETSVLKEAKSIMGLFTNPAMLVLIIPFASSNWFYQYQFTSFQAYFNTRSQTLNNIFFWGSQMAASWVMGNAFLDKLEYGGRNRRAWIGFSIISTSTLAVWGFGAVFQSCIDPHDNGYLLEFTNRTTRIDFLETANPMWPLWFLGLGLYMSYGVYDAFFQAYTYWLLGSLSHDAAINSRYAGFYKAVQSLFAAISWVLGDKTLHASFPNIFPSMNISPMQMFLITMTPMVASCFCFAVFVKKFVIDIDEEEEVGGV